MAKLPEDFDPRCCIVGAPEAPDEATEIIQKICDEVKPQAEAQTNRTYDVFNAVTFTQQVIAGTLYNIKVHVGDNKHITIVVLKRLPCNPGRRYEVLEVKDNEDVVLICRVSDIV